MHTQAINSTRIDFRTTADVKALIERAATLQGLAVSEYIKSVIVSKSHEIVEQHQTRRLSDRDRDRFLMLLDNPPEPNAALRAASVEFKTKVSTGSLVP